MATAVLSITAKQKKKEAEKNKKDGGEAKEEKMDVDDDKKEKKKDGKKSNYRACLTILTLFSLFIPISCLSKISLKS